MIATATQPINRLSRQLTWPGRDTSLDAIDQFNDSSKWTIRRGVPVFAAHEVRDDDGKLLLKVDKAKLAEIAANTNRREQEAGEACPLMLGHVPRGPKVPEDALGDIVGYARNFRVGHFGAKKQLGILADFYFLPQHYARAMQFPRRSAELWLADWILDPIALLKRTPRQNLGTLLPGGEEGCVLQELLKAGSDGCSLLTYSRGPDRRVYQLESEDRMDVPSILAKLDELRAMIAGEEGMEQNAMPSGSNTAPPDLLGGGAGPMQFSKEDYEKAIKERDQFRLLYQKADRTTKLEKLTSTYVLNVAEELKDSAHLDDKGFERHLDRIRRCYARTERKPDEGGSFIPTGDGPDGHALTEDKLDDYQWYERHSDRVKTYAREHQLDDLAEATKRCRLAK